MTRLLLRDQALIAEAAASLAVAGIVLKTVSFAKTARRLGEHMAESALTEAPAAIETARRVGRAIEAAARRLPWKPMCFPQALAATLMLRRRGIRSTLYLGVDPQRDLDAHAWVRVGGLIVTGGPDEARFVVVSTFA